jgi:hypothetical protein
MNQLSRVEEILSQKVNLNWRCEEKGLYYSGWTPLMCALYKSYTQISEKLSLSGAEEPSQEGFAWDF